MMEGPLLAQFFQQIADSIELFLARTSGQVRNHNGVDDLTAQRIKRRSAPAHGLGVRGDCWSGQRG